MNLFENLQKMKQCESPVWIGNKKYKNSSNIKPYGGDGKNWAMFYSHDNNYNYSDIVNYAKSKGFDKEYWGSDEAPSYGFKGIYNGDTTVVFKDANLLPDGYKEDALKYGKPLEENKTVKNENVSYTQVVKEIKDIKNKLKKKDIIEDFGQDEVRRLRNKYDLFALMNVDFNEKDKILRAIDMFDDWCQTYTPFKTIKNESKYNSNITTTSELYSEIQKLLRDASLDEDNISLNDLFNCYSIDDLLDLYDCLSKEYDAEKYNDNINTKSQLWNEFKKLLLDDLQEPENREKISLDEICNCFSFEKIKELYDYLSSEYQDNWDEDEEDLEEATSGIGGAYTTQAIDILPKGIKKVNEVAGKTKKNWSIFADYEFKIDKELAIPKLLEISKDIDNNKYLNDEDKKELKDFINKKCKGLKIEAITKFYDKEFDDEDLKSNLDYTKNNPVNYENDKYMDVVNYENKNYYLASEGKEIVFDGQNCLVFLAIDEDINKYLIYYKYTFGNDGDPENGMKAPETIVDEVPYKVVSVE